MCLFARSAKIFFESRKIYIFKPLKNHKGGWTRFKGGGRIYTYPGHFLRGGGAPPPDPTRGGRIRDFGMNHGRFCRNIGLGHVNVITRLSIYSMMLAEFLMDKKGPAVLFRPHTTLKNSRIMESV